jgi:GGDEF domain-containing protein
VSEAQARHPAPRARPLADLPIDDLAARGEELAKRWALALILARPLEQIAEIPFEEIALDGPSLCAQALRALEADSELSKLTGQGPPNGREGSALARRLAAIVGAGDVAGVVDAVEALRGVLWPALAEELGEADARLVGDVADRLAHVCAAILAVAVTTVQEAEKAADLSDDGAGAASAGGGQPVARSGPRAVIVDELSSAPQPRAQPQPRAPALAPALAPARTAPPEGPSEVIEIRDERGGDGPVAWIGTIGRQLERFRRDGLPFAVLLAELTGLERLREQEGNGEAERMARVVQELLQDRCHETSAGAERAGSREPATITRERPGRYWLIAPQLDPMGAQRLAERLTAEVASLRTAGGRSMALAIGTSSCPQDGREAAALAAHADVGRYAARASAGVTSPPGPISVERPT